MYPPSWVFKLLVNNLMQAALLLEEYRMGCLIEVPEDVDEALRKLEAEGRILCKNEFIWQTIRRRLKEMRKD